MILDWSIDRSKVKVDEIEVRIESLIKFKELKAPIFDQIDQFESRSQLETKIEESKNRFRVLILLIEI